MNKNRILIVLMAVVALVVVATLTGVFQQQDVLSMDYPEVNVPAEAVHTVRIETAENKLTIRKFEDGWRLTRPIEAPVEEPLINGFLRRVADFDIEGVLTAEPTRYEEYGVTRELGRQIEIEWDGGEVEFLIAGLGENYQEEYVRVEGDPRVFYLSRRMPVNDTAVQWRDKRIVHIAPATVSSIQVSGPGRDYTILRDDDGRLRLDGGGQIDSAAAAIVLARYSMFRTDGFAPDKVDAKPDDVRESPDVTVVIRHDGEASTQETTLWWKELDGYYGIVRDDDDTVFLVSSPRVNDVAPALSAVRLSE